jgi:hypothetical protein
VDTAIEQLVWAHSKGLLEERIVATDKLCTALHITAKKSYFLCGTGRYLYTDGQPECGERGAILSSFVFHIVYVAERIMHE